MVTKSRWAMAVLIASGKGYLVAIYALTPAGKRMSKTNQTDKSNNALKPEAF